MTRVLRRKPGIRLINSKIIKFYYTTAPTNWMRSFSMLLGKICTKCVFLLPKYLDYLYFRRLQWKLSIRKRRMENKETEQSFVTPDVQFFSCFWNSIFPLKPFVLDVDFLWPIDSGALIGWSNHDNLSKYTIIRGRKFVTFRVKKLPFSWFSSKYQVNKNFDFEEIVREQFTLRGGFKIMSNGYYRKNTIEQIKNSNEGLHPRFATNEETLHDWSFGRNICSMPLSINITAVNNNISTQRSPECFRTC